MTHKSTGGHSRGNLGISRASTAATSGKYTRGPNYSGPRASMPDSRLHTVKLGGGHSAKVPKHPYGR